MRVGALPLLAAIVLACRGGGGDPVAPTGTTGPGPTGTSGPTGATGPTGPTGTGPTAACTVSDDLSPPTAPTACPAIAPLGAPVSLSFVRHFTAACADQIAVNGDGSVAFRAVEALGGGGYWRSWLEPFGPDATRGAEQPGDVELLVPGAHGFLTFTAPTAVGWTDSAWSEWHAAAIAWPVTLPGGLFWPASYVGLLAAGPGLDGDLLVALAGADPHGDAEVDVTRVSPGPVLPIAPSRAFTIPSPATDWTTDREATALRAATGSVAIAADGAGRILLLWDGTAACGAGTIAGRWFAPDGAALGPPFLAAHGRLAPDPSGLERASRLFRLQDGSLVLRAADGTFMRWFADGAPAGGPAPAWLAARTGEDLSPLPLAGVVASIQAPAGATGARVDVVGGDGAFCWTATLPAPDLAAASVPPGTTTAAVGVDGTLVAIDRVDPVGATTNGSCVYRVWRGALR
jgi:hypothetical protein